MPFIPTANFGTLSHQSDCTPRRKSTVRINRRAFDSINQSRSEYFPPPLAHTKPEFAFAGRAPEPSAQQQVRPAPLSSHFHCPPQPTSEICCGREDLLRVCVRVHFTLVSHISTGATCNFALPLFCVFECGSIKHDDLTRAGEEAVIEFWLRWFCTECVGVGAAPERARVKN